MAATIRLWPENHCLRFRFGASLLCLCGNTFKLAIITYQTRNECLCVGLIWILLNVVIKRSALNGNDLCGNLKSVYKDDVIFRDAR